MDELFQFSLSTLASLIASAIVELIKHHLDKK